MKICLHTIFAVTQRFIGGTERFLIDIAKELKLLGHDPFIVCSSPVTQDVIEEIPVYGRIPDYCRAAFDKYAFFSSKFLKNEIISENYSAESLKRLSHYTKCQLSEFSADVLHLNSFVSASFFEPNAACIVTNHENNMEYDSYWGQGFFSFMSEMIRQRKTVLHRWDRLFTPSRYYADFFAQHFELPVTGINLGVSLPNFKIDQFDPEFREEYSMTSEELLILLPSRFQMVQKGHATALEAAAILKNKGVKFKIIFSGMKRSCEKYIPEFEAMVEKLKVAKHVQITRFAQIQNAYQGCDIVISPEKYCSYGLSISESLALGIPTVLSNIPTYREIAKGYAHAFFFDKDSPEEMAEAIKQASEYKGKRFIEEAISFRSNYDLRQCAKHYSSIYSDLNPNQNRICV